MEVKNGGLLERLVHKLGLLEFDITIYCELLYY